jgi:hypothetical protein
MDSTSTLMLSIENGNIIIKSLNSNLDDDKKTSSTNSNESINLSFNNNYENAYFYSNASIINMNNKESKIVFTNLLKENWENEIIKIKNNILDKYIMERFPF